MEASGNLDMLFVSRVNNTFIKKDHKRRMYAMDRNRFSCYSLDANQEWIAKKLT